MIRRKMIIINVSSGAMLRNTFALEFRIYQNKSLEKPIFWIGKKQYVCIYLPINY